jgi:hypothetical protein
MIELVPDPSRSQELQGSSGWPRPDGNSDTCGTLDTVDIVTFPVGLSEVKGDYDELGVAVPV